MTKSATIADAAEDAATDSDELPEGWALAGLTKVCALNPGKPAKDSVDEATPVTFVPMPAVDAESGTILTPSVRPFGEVRKGFTSFRDGDVIFAKITPCMENGKSAIARSLTNGLGFGSTEFHVLRPTSAVLAEYVHYFVRQESFRRAAAEEMTGSVGQKRVPAAYLDGVSIPLPPLAEQKRIVAEIERLLAEVNKAREHLDRVPKLLKRFRQSILAAATTGRLTEDWRAETTVELTGKQLVEAIQQKRVELGLKSAERVIDDEDIELPESELADTWYWCRVGQIADVRLGGTPSRKMPKYWDGSVPWVSSGEVANCRIATTSERITEAGVDASSAKLYPKGTVLIAMIGEGKTRGQSAILDIDSTTNQNVAGLVFDAGHVEPEYVWLWALAEYEKTRNIGRGGNQPALNGRKVRALPVPLPPIEEQREIVGRVRAMLSVADEIEASMDLAIHRAELVPQAILAKAFLGELVPTEAELVRTQNRPYESATQLLARLSADTPDGKAKGRSTVRTAKSPKARAGRNQRRRQ